MRRQTLAACKCFCWERGARARLGGVFTGRQGAGDCEAEKRCCFSCCGGLGVDAGEGRLSSASDSPRGGAPAGGSSVKPAKGAAVSRGARELPSVGGPQDLLPRRKVPRAAAAAATSAACTRKRFDAVALEAGASPAAPTTTTTPPTTTTTPPAAARDSPRAFPRSAVGCQRGWGGSFTSDVSLYERRHSPAVARLAKQRERRILPAPGLKAAELSGPEETPQRTGETLAHVLPDTSHADGSGVFSVLAKRLQSCALI